MATHLRAAGYPRAPIGRACAVLTIALALVACAAAGKPRPRKDLLTFLVDGQSTCADVIRRLGEPSRHYESSQLLTYRIARDSASRYSIVVADTWRQANYSLVIRCNAQGTVLSHALVSVKGS